jgi:predicted component of type VI protein secretion system
LVRDRLHPESNELFHECVDSLLQYGVDAWTGQGPYPTLA